MKLYKRKQVTRTETVLVLRPFIYFVILLPPAVWFMLQIIGREMMPVVDMIFSCWWALSTLIYVTGTVTFGDLDDEV